MLLKIKASAQKNSINIMALKLYINVFNMTDIQKQTFMSQIITQILTFQQMNIGSDILISINETIIRNVDLRLFQETLDREISNAQRISYSPEEKITVEAQIYDFFDKMKFIVKYTSFSRLNNFRLIPNIQLVKLRNILQEYIEKYEGLSETILSVSLDQNETDEQFIRAMQHVINFLTNPIYNDARQYMTSLIQKPTTAVHDMLIIHTRIDGLLRKE